MEDGVKRLVHSAPPSDGNGLLEYGIFVERARPAHAQRVAPAAGSLRTSTRTEIGCARMTYNILSGWTFIQTRGAQHNTTSLYVAELNGHLGVVEVLLGRGAQH